MATRLLLQGNSRKTRISGFVAYSTKKKIHFRQHGIKDPIVGKANHGIGNTIHLRRHGRKATIWLRQNGIKRAIGIQYQNGNMTVFEINRASIYFREGGRAVECTGFENRRSLDYRGFESLPFRFSKKA